MDGDPCYASATEALAGFRAHTLSPVELMQAVIERASKVEPRINAFSETFFESAMAQARRAEARYAGGGEPPRPLEGIPLAVKEETPVAGQRCTQGSLLYRDQVAHSTAPSVARLLEAGAIVHARSTAPEFSCATITHSRLWGVTRNPWNPEFSPGGSSGGSAAALAAGSATLATGSDIAGSIRIPAACCGVVGFKPPYGRVPEEPPYNLDSYCHEGPLARTVADCALMENVMAGPHPRDHTSLRPKLVIPAELPPIRGWRIAWSPDLGHCEVDPEVARNTRAAVEVFRELGCRVDEIQLPWTSAVRDAARGHLGHLFGNLVARELDRADLMTDYARTFAEEGRRTTAEDLLDAMQVAGRMYDDLGPLLERYRLLICPTNALPAVRAEHDPVRDPLEINGVVVDPLLGWVMTHPFNMLSRCPVVSVPSGRAESGVPTGIQIVAPTYDDVSVFAAAAAYEAVCGWLDTPARRPAL